MKALWQSEAIACAVKGTASADFSVRNVAFDSREIQKGDLFFALKGTESDGHNYVDAAFKRGAAGAVVMSPVPYPHILVDDSYQALKDLAVASRKRNHGKIIGITGSVGKTSTKESLRLALERMAPEKVHYSLKSYNNHVGVPLSLARMPEESLFGIFEMGMNHAGELSDLTKLVQPDVALITAIAPAHAAFFADETAIAEAKSEIFEGLSSGGIAIIPHDSPYRDLLTAKAQEKKAEIRSFGFGEGATIRAQNIVREADGRVLVTASIRDRQLVFSMAMAAEHWISNAMAVLAVVDAVGGDLTLASLALGDITGFQGRGQRFDIPVGDGSAIVIDESYNANPASMAATIKALENEPKDKRRIVLLGDMLELGQNSAAYHRALADPLSHAKVDHVLLVGQEMAALEESLAGKIACDRIEKADQAEALLDEILKADDILLVKGSNSLGLSAVVSSLSKKGCACSI
ncbi:UDP-N-acetylmuramoyl-tripeptide--D-alanyl-D-alanine ligase [Zymomonas mobilis]|uniref:UDP-N-acetylmuramoyl-tripeptide--D-alanyl-D- alanine ligase n=1 Tax=Zymomonas mobilis TaxID=542 RepID=UPI0003C75CF5|nr:UDP-N-acetylmuramoyl-tripeptide--D-alanyl-D-alanine ligase [Zymomonas mobilis]AHB09797.1 UDP-N-acetylmuramoyl-tripeptide--D-alanyl-D-alanine ligase [Zymomonas mobilis subsp. mobilis str. CP4 = NRRL B-14023]AHJ70102.1 UDP-N-acetylmuramoyl-tripeptide--D-alanyl-D-alanine ligase [Zymomonas mobilis subsp. mobilis NRRL B-12526]AHJ71957.1 UDP-N-acetylmuramoyl-tripeptide--D-alanyl-D-alanine ligase [Zymomonas mobilis subsp. mobilis str. CP4 = NRRL B-14023]TWE25290.1 UDP-N-acetylmuramoyl-tripeptide--D